MEVHTKEMKLDPQHHKNKHQLRMHQRCKFKSGDCEVAETKCKGSTSRHCFMFLSKK